jgi:hypothetical protein
MPALVLLYQSQSHERPEMALEGCVRARPFTAVVLGESRDVGTRVDAAARHASRFGVPPRRREQRPLLLRQVGGFGAVTGYCVGCKRTSDVLIIDEDVVPLIALCPECIAAHNARLIDAAVDAMHPSPVLEPKD